jgi:large subunit ribosomal protein L25
MDIIKIAAKKRDKVGTRAAMRDRSEGRLPAVIYGHGSVPEHITIDTHQFEMAVKHHARVFQLDQDGSESIQALLKQLQWDALGEIPMHADFTRLEIGEKVQVGVPIHFVGHAKGLGAGGRLSTPVVELQIECAPSAIPEHIEVVVTDLELGQAIHVGDLKLPASVTVLSDPSVVICNVTMPSVQSTEAEGAEDGAEPDRIGGDKPAND